MQGANCALILWDAAKSANCKMPWGERLVPATLAILHEPFEAWPLRDRLNRLEKQGVSMPRTGLLGAWFATVWRMTIPTNRKFVLLR